ncbi:MAG: hypothetical protein NC350_06485 [Corallococcus sp.]|nr:hypothetical protein [Corallococcus sp.]
MLNKREVAVMKCVYDLSRKNDGSCIVSNKRILQSVPEKFKLADNDIDTILKQLEYDGYFECVKSDKRGEIVNVINLKEKGKAFKRELVQRRREIGRSFAWRMAYAAVGAVVTFVVTQILGK